MKLRTSGQECSLDGGFELGSPHRLARRGVFFGVCDARSPHGAPAYLAQVVEHLLHKQKVGGLIPSRRTFFRNIDGVIGGGCLGLWFRSIRHSNVSLVRMVECLLLRQKVGGSIPSTRTFFPKIFGGLYFFGIHSLVWGGVCRGLWILAGQGVGGGWREEKVVSLPSRPMASVCIWPRLIGN